MLQLTHETEEPPNVTAPLLPNHLVVPVVVIETRIRPYPWARPCSPEGSR